MNQFKKEEAESLWSGLVKGGFTPPVDLGTCGGGVVCIIMSRQVVVVVQWQ